jgi:hypothetical protein
MVALDTKGINFILKYSIVSEKLQQRKIQAVENEFFFELQRTL